MMDSYQIVNLGMAEAKTTDVRWLVIDLLLAVADRAMTVFEAEKELTGLVDDPAGLLSRVAGKGESL